MKKFTAFLVFLLFLLLTCIVTYPLIFHLSTYVFGKGDELLISWILNWNIHALLHNPLHIFGANIFYPYQQTLSFSEPFFTSSLLAFIPVLIWKEPLLAFNINVILSLTLLGFAAYCLSYYLSKKNTFSILSGILVAFSPFTLGRVFQFQVISIQWIPFGIISLFHFLKTKKTRYFALACLFFLLQMANSFLTGYFVVLCYLVILGFFLLSKKLSLLKIINAKIIFIVIITGVITILLGYPYFKTSNTFHYVRDIRDTIHFANRPEYTFYPNNRTRLAPVLLKTIYSRDKGPYRYDGYWGLAFIIAFIVSAIGLLKLKKQDRFLPFIFFTIALSSFVLSLGPAFQWAGKVIKHPFIIPLPYAILYYVIPGFKGIRNSARWEMLTILASGIFIALVLAQLMKNKNRLFTIIIIFFISLAALLEINLPFSYVQVPMVKDFPPVYSYINSLPQNATVIHLPIFSWDMQPYANEEFMREYFSIINFRRTVNGYSGFSPKEWEQNVKFLTSEFPNIKTIAYLQHIKVNYIILHKKNYDDLYKNKYVVNQIPIPPFTTIINNVKSFQQLQLVTQFGDDYVYKLK